MATQTLTVKDGLGATQTTEAQPNAANANALSPQVAIGYVSGSNVQPVTTAYGFPVQAADGALASLGATTDASAGSDSANVSQIALFKRLLARLTTLLAGGLPAALGAGGGLKIDGSGTALPVSGTVTVGTLPATPAGNNLIGDVARTLVKVVKTPTLSTAASYVSGDFVGTDATAIDFSDLLRGTGACSIVTAVLVDYATQSKAMELWLFDDSITPPNDSAAWAISDADALKCVGVIPFSTYYASGNNSVANGVIPNGRIAVKGGANTLVGALVVRDTPTYASGDVSVVLTAEW